MNNANRLVERYIQSWNEIDPVRRARYAGRHYSGGTGTGSIRAGRCCDGRAIASVGTALKAPYSNIRGHMGRETLEGAITHFIMLGDRLHP